jgi:hypothetical protein
LWIGLACKQRTCLAVGNLKLQVKQEVGLQATLLGLKCTSELNSLTNGGANLVQRDHLARRHLLATGLLPQLMAGLNALEKEGHHSVQMAGYVFRLGEYRFED